MRWNRPSLALILRAVGAASAYVYLGERIQHGDDAATDPANADGLAKFNAPPEGDDE